MLLKLDGGEPLYVQVYRALSRAIEDGRFPPSTRLPGTRTLARELGVSRTVVLQAYEQLESEGVIAGSPGSGTFVQGRAEPAPTTLVPAGAVEVDALTGALQKDLLSPSPWAVRARDGMPVPAMGSGQAAGDLLDLAQARTFQDDQGARRWRQALLAALNEPHDDLRDIRGLAELRRALALELHQSRAINVDPDEILVVAGIQQARDLVARVLVQPGMSIALEEPCDPAVRATFAAMGARLMLCAVGTSGFDIEYYAAQLASASLAYVMPSQQFPTGAVMGVRQRLSLLRWAYARGAYVIEDDFEPEHRLVSNAAPPLFAIDQRAQVIYIGALAREFFPGLHMGYVIAPRALRPFFEAAKWVADRGARFLMQRVLARYLSTGEYQSNLRRLFVLLVEKRAALVAALSRYFGERAIVTGDTVSGALLVQFPDAATSVTDAWLARAEAIGVRAVSAAAWYARPPAHAVLLLRYAHVQGERLDAAVRLLALAYDEIKPHASLQAIAC
ncbi:PLP-dependent aminotransferase family protein [Dyella sp. KRB-257]|uniref:aminotransferase-like domain-containing protein n=1 Tax=Dyella sp. KRB-257 TaxID=3400915 RepID=UPI003C0D848A